MRRDGGTPRQGPVRAGAKAPKGVATGPFDAVQASFLAEARDADSLPPEGLPEVAFAGRSNVGKSTLLNALCQRRGLARTSRTPGCTRGVVVYHLRIRRGDEVRLVDLPGYGFADRSHGERRAWQSLIENYLSKRTALRAVFILVDARRGVEDEELELARYLDAHAVPYALLATKVDKMSKAERGVTLEKLTRETGVRVLGVSGETGEGREQLVRTLVYFARRSDEAGSDDRESNSPG